MTSQMGCVRESEQIRHGKSADVPLYLSRKAGFESSSSTVLSVTAVCTRAMEIVFVMET